MKTPNDKVWSFCPAHIQLLIWKGRGGQVCLVKRWQTQQQLQGAYPWFHVVFQAVLESLITIWWIMVSSLRKTCPRAVNFSIVVDQLQDYNI
jgi:hypothetical protein